MEILKFFTPVSEMLEKTTQNFCQGWRHPWPGDTWAPAAVRIAEPCVSMPPCPLAARPLAATPISGCIGWQGAGAPIGGRGQNFGRRIRVHAWQESACVAPPRYQRVASAG
jgi:hypothetical protein